VSGGNISDKIKESSGKDIDRWKEKFHKQVEANNLLSDKLRRTRMAAKKVIIDMQQAYQLQLTKLITTQAEVVTLKAALGEKDES